MDMNIFKNSYVAFAVTFVTLYATFYLLGVGYRTEMVNGKEVKKSGWKYPLGLALIIWACWHFVLYPANNNFMSTKLKNNTDMNGGFKKSSTVPKINMKIWH